MDLFCSMKRRGLIAIALSMTLSACSLIDPKSRPDPTVNHVHCALEYQPCVDPDTNDLVFLAASYPYNSDQFNVSLPDAVLHQVLAPGRHLKVDARVEGAVCSTRPWKKGFRLPASLDTKKWMLCRRIDLQPVLFEVETKWGVCTRRIPGGDTSPRNLELRTRNRNKLPELG